MPGGEPYEAAAAGARGMTGDTRRWWRAGSDGGAPGAASAAADKGDQVKGSHGRLAPLVTAVGRHAAPRRNGRQAERKASTADARGPAANPATLAGF